MDLFASTPSDEVSRFAVSLDNLCFKEESGFGHKNATCFSYSILLTIRGLDC